MNTALDRLYPASGVSFTEHLGDTFALASSLHSLHINSMWFFKVAYSAEEDNVELSARPPVALEENS